MTERDINNRVLGVYPMTFRNDNGTAYVGGIKRVAEHDALIINPKLIRYGLQPGSGDRIGWRTIVITPDMVGQKIAQFLSIEIKTLRDHMRPAQIKWAQAVRRDGGRAEIWKETKTGEIDVLIFEKGVL